MAKKKLAKKKGNWRRAMAISASALAASGALWYLTGTSGVKIPVPAYRAMRVIDGDTFETEERQIIRLTGIDAPELEYCDGPESKKALEKLILNQNLYVKVIFRNGFRLVSYVYNEDGSVSEQMLKVGMAYYLSKDVSHPELERAGDAARETKLGIYSSKCTQATNPDSQTCVIKGNIRTPNKDKIYHFPGCKSYTQTLVELYKGDKWFCTEAQAKKEGFAKGADCFDKTF
ncbi:thermonuclease family protein [Patescibacteria group bacterium]|nr:thermonuclease family protein [Patescibacteria group bacterium]